MTRLLASALEWRVPHMLACIAGKGLVVLVLTLAILLPMIFTGA